MTAMLVVGPEEPLVKGISDFFDQSEKVPSIPVIGPSASGAQLEGSKDFAKAFMKKHNIPTAGYATFTAENINAADVKQIAKLNLEVNELKQFPLLKKSY